MNAQVRMACMKSTAQAHGHPGPQPRAERYLPTKIPVTLQQAFASPASRTSKAMATSL